MSARLPGAAPRLAPPAAPAPSPPPGFPPLRVHGHGCACRLRYREARVRAACSLPLLPLPSWRSSGSMTLRQVHFASVDLELHARFKPGQVRLHALQLPMLLCRCRPGAAAAARSAACVGLRNAGCPLHVVACPWRPTPHRPSLHGQLSPAARAEAVVLARPAGPCVAAGAGGERV